MEKLTTTMKEAIKDKIDNITKIAKDYINIIDHDYKFVGGYEEIMFYSQFHKTIKSKLLEIEDILDNTNNARDYIELGIEFIDWADYYFQNEFNKVIDRNEAYVSFKCSFPAKGRITLSSFIRKVKMWCEIRGYEYNPEDIMKQRSEIERNRNEIRFMKVICDSEKICYGFYIGNKEENNNQTL